MVVKYQVIVTLRAEQSFLNILAYLVEEASPEAAEQVRKKILEAIYKLETLPSANPPMQGVNSAKGILYRKVLVWSYCILYAVEEDPRQIFIVDILHTKRNPDIIKKSLK